MVQETYVEADTLSNLGLLKGNAQTTEGTS